MSYMPIEPSERSWHLGLSFTPYSWNPTLAKNVVLVNLINPYRTTWTPEGSLQEYTVMLVETLGALGNSLTWLLVNLCSCLLPGNKITGDWLSGNGMPVTGSKESLGREGGVPKNVMGRGAGSDLMSGLLMGVALHLVITRIIVKLVQRNNINVTQCCICCMGVDYAVSVFVFL